MNVRWLYTIFVLFCFADELFAGLGKGGRNYGSGTKTSGSRSRWGGIGGRAYKTGLSKNKKKALFFGAGALAGVYIGNRMRSSVHLRSYRDLYNYEVCEGIHQDFSPYSNTKSMYSYFICPDDPNQPFEKYCCQSPETGTGYCCSYQQRSGSTIGGVIGAILVIGAISLICYFCCCRRRVRRGRIIAQPSPLETQKPESPPLPANFGSTPYPVDQPYGATPVAPIAYGGFYPPPQTSMTGAPQVPASGMPGSGWGFAPPGQPPTMDLPPPYPGYLTSPSATTHVVSAPPEKM